MAKVLLLCGKICCGKSTYARSLGSGYVTLSCDELMLSLFEEQLGDKHQEVTEKSKKYLLSLAGQILNAGANVILDWGFWKKEERLAVRKQLEAAGHSTELIYLKLSEEEWKRRIAKRNRERDPLSYYVDDNMVQLFGSMFEEPGEDEEPNVPEATAAEKTDGNGSI